MPVILFILMFGVVGFMALVLCVPFGQFFYRNGVALKRGFTWGKLCLVLLLFPLMFIAAVVMHWARTGAWA